MFTKISLASYDWKILRPADMRMIGLVDKRLIGYCKQSPQEVLRATFTDYNIVNYRGVYFIETRLFMHKEPLVGLDIKALEPVFGISGNLADFLRVESEKLARARRGQKIESEKVEEILLGTTRQINNSVELDPFIEIEIQNVLNAYTNKIQKAT